MMCNQVQVYIKKDTVVTNMKYNLIFYGIIIGCLYILVIYEEDKFESLEYAGF